MHSVFNTCIAGRTEAEEQGALETSKRYEECVIVVRYVPYSVLDRSTLSKDVSAVRKMMVTKLPST